jgi:hypothetical protein
MQFFMIYIIGERIYGDDLMKHNRLRKTDYLVYKNIPCSIMSEKEIIDTSNLFSMVFILSRQFQV